MVRVRQLLLATALACAGSFVAAGVLRDGAVDGGSAALYSGLGQRPSLEAPPGAGGGLEKRQGGQSTPARGRRRPPRPNRRPEGPVRRRGGGKAKPGTKQYETAEGSASPKGTAVKPTATQEAAGTPTAAQEAEKDSTSTQEAEGKPTTVQETDQASPANQEAAKKATTTHEADGTPTTTQAAMGNSTMTQWAEQKPATPQEIEDDSTTAQETTVKKLHTPQKTKNNSTTPAVVGDYLTEKPRFANASLPEFSLTKPRNDSTLADRETEETPHGTVHDTPRISKFAKPSGLEPLGNSTLADQIVQGAPQRTVEVSPENSELAEPGDLKNPSDSLVRTEQKAVELPQGIEASPVEEFESLEPDPPVLSSTQDLDSWTRVEQSVELSAYQRPKASLPDIILVKSEDTRGAKKPQRLQSAGTSRVGEGRAQQRPKTSMMSYPAANSTSTSTDSQLPGPSPLKSGEARVPGKPQQPEGAHVGDDVPRGVGRAGAFDEPRTFTALTRSRGGLNIMATSDTRASAPACTMD